MNSSFCVVFSSLEVKDLRCCLDAETNTGTDTDVDVDVDAYTNIDTNADTNAIKDTYFLTKVSLTALVQIPMPIPIPMLMSIPIHYEPIPSLWREPTICLISTYSILRLNEMFTGSRKNIVLMMGSGGS